MFFSWIDVRTVQVNLDQLASMRPVSRNCSTKFNKSHPSFLTCSKLMPLRVDREQYMTWQAIPVLTRGYKMNPVRNHHYQIWSRQRMLWLQKSRLLYILIRSTPDRCKARMLEELRTRATQTRSLSRWNNKSNRFLNQRAITEEVQNSSSISQIRQSTSLKTLTKEWEKPWISR